MLQLVIPAVVDNYWDEDKEEFIDVTKTKAATIHLEHSLVSLSKWESIWHKSFFSKEEKTPEEIMSYIKCMTLDKNVDSQIYDRITKENITEIMDYINNPMTATTFPKEKKQSIINERITNELIYYWMVSLNIPVEFEKWHINRLLTLIRVCEVKNTPSKKRSKADIMRSNAATNAARRKMWNTRG